MAPGVVSFPETTLQKMYENLEDKEEWDNGCDLCDLPSMLHSDVQGNRVHGACTRNNDMIAEDITKEWEEFRKRMKEIRKWYRDKRKTLDLEETVNNMINLQNEVAIAIKAIQTGTTNKLIKPAKVPVWSKGMQLTPFIKSLEVWVEYNRELPDHSKYNEIV